MPTSITVNEVKVGDVISATIYGSGIVPNLSFSKVIGIVSGESVSSPETAAASHANIYPSLDQDLVTDNFVSYNYLVVSDDDYGVREIGYPWIVQATLIRAERTSLQMTVTDFDNSRLEELKTLMRSRGFITVTYKVS